MPKHLPYELIDYLQPFITEKVTHSCDLERQEKEWHPATSDVPDRHRGHGWCYVHDEPCGCPCHWSEDKIAFVLLDAMRQYEIPEHAREWLDGYRKRQEQEAARLRTLANERTAMVTRVKQAMRVAR